MKLRAVSFIAFGAAFFAVIGLSAGISNAAVSAQATLKSTALSTMSATMSATMDVPNTTLLRIVHAAPGAPHIDVYLDKQTTPTITDLPYAGSTKGYLAVNAGDHEIKITAAGNIKTVVFDQTLTLPGGAAFTLVAEGLLDAKTFRVRFFQDDLSATNGAARVKIIHAIPDAPPVDVVTSDFTTTLALGLKYGAAIALDVPPGPYDLYVLPHGSQDKSKVVIDLTGTKLEADHIYTIVATGALTGKDKTPAAPLLFDMQPVAGFQPPVVPTAVATAAQ